jgi:hypothetical protein
MRESDVRFAVCVNNAGYPASLELHKIYRILPDEDVELDGDLRIVEESGEDYLYPANTSSSRSCQHNDTLSAVMNNYYVYVYIDPRNFEEFYCGKGKGSRNTAHVFDVSDSEKARRIKDIKKVGLEPIIRVIASNLTEQEALLIEATLIWKLGRFTTNIAGGHFASKFRPHNTYHTELSGFDYQNGIYYYNVGEGPHRDWDDYVKYGFISAGQGERWRDATLRFQKGDVVVAYLKRHGFVGVGSSNQPDESETWK